MSVQPINDIILTPEDARTIQQRTFICQQKSNRMELMQIELDMLNNSMKELMGNILLKYNLDPSKKYAFNGTTLTLIEQNNEADQKIEA